MTFRSEESFVSIICSWFGVALCGLGGAISMQPGHDLLGACMWAAGLFFVLLR